MCRENLGSLRSVADRLVVIGGDAAGMTAATNARRGRPDLEIVVLEKGPHTSYSACGIPYVVSGAVGGLDDLIVRTPQEFRDGFRIDVRTRHEARSIDLDARRIEVRALDQERTLHLGFDLLHIATGARPLRPDLPGIDGQDIYGVQTLDATVLPANDADFQSLFWNNEGEQAAGSNEDDVVLATPYVSGDGPLNLSLPKVRPTHLQVLWIEFRPHAATAK